MKSEAHLNHHERHGRGIGAQPGHGIYTPKPEGPSTLMLAVLFATAAAGALGLLFALGAMCSL
jgi:hypothetical protein